MTMRDQYRRKLRLLIFKIRDLAPSSTRKAKILKYVDYMRAIPEYNNKFTDAEKRERVEDRSRLDYILLILGKCVKHWRLFCIKKDKNEFGAFSHLFLKLHKIVDDTEHKTYILKGEEGRGYYLEEVEQTQEGGIE